MRPCTFYNGDASTVSMHKRLISLIKDSPLDLILTILDGFFIGLLIIWQASLLSTTINRVFLEGASVTHVTPLLKTLALVIILRAVLSWGSEVSANSIAIRIKTDLRERLFQHLLELGPSFARGERTGELTTTATEGIEALDAYFSQYVPMLVIAALVPLTILIFVFPLDPLSGITLLLTAPLIPVFMILIGKAAEALTHQQYDTLRRLSAHFLDSLQGLTTLKQFGRSKAHARNIKNASDQFRDATLNVLRVTFLSALVLEMIATISTAIIAVEVGLRLLYGRMEFQQALFLLVLAPEFYVPLRMMGLRFHAGISGTVAARRIFEILDTPMSVKHSVTKDQPLITSDLKTLSIQLSDIHFTYPGENTPALKNIDFQIKTGQHIAVVGASGAGKTTLIGLLLRFVEPTGGNLTVNGVDMKEIHPSVWREQIAWVPQKPHLFHDTIDANIRLANPSASDEQVVAAAQAAHLHDFVQALPEGYQTLVGESGTRLSGGQAQRLALARAFLKNAPLLILDEPTSSLDPEQESILEDSIEKLTQGRTVITIAHRLNTIFSADRILVMDGGQIVETGTHQDLLKKNGKYVGFLHAYTRDEGVTADIQRRNEPLHKFSGNLGDLIMEQNKLDKLPLQTVPHSPAASTFRRLLAFLNGSWNLVALSILLGVVTIGANIALMGTSAYLISAAALHPSIADLQVAIIGVRFFGIARGVFRYLERLASHTVTFRLLSRLRVWFYSALEPLAPARLMTYRSGDLLSRIVVDVNTLENFYVRVVSPPLVALVIMLGMSLILAAFDLRLGWALMGFLFIMGVVVPLATQAVSQKPGRELVVSRAELQSQLVEDIQGMPDVIAFGRQLDKAAQLHSTGVIYKAAQRRMAFISGLNNGLSVLLANLGMWVILVLAVQLVSTGQIPGVDLAAIAMAALASFEAVTPLPLAAQMLGTSLESAKRLFDVVDAKPAVIDRNVTGNVLDQSIGEIKFESVSFSYGESDSAALDRVDFCLDKGKSLALVGPSGAGKSTILQLLQRFWDFNTGGITISLQSIKDFSQDDVRRLFAVVSQNSFFFNATIRQNLLLANPAATQDQIESSARQAQIHDFIAGLPAGYETRIGEMGARLSGGERQRLAIARALLKDAPILLLDEPTANLDPLTEGAVLETLWNVMKRRTTLMISHRFVGLDHFDEILVLDQGRIIERGSHAELLKLDGLYRRLWDIQNRILLADQ
jgi:ATP-binding cassette, subfamily C, bacterial CydCD